MAKNADEIIEVENNGANSEQEDPTILNSISELNNNVQSLDSHCGELLIELTDIITKLDQLEGKSEQLLKYMTDEQYAVQDAINSGVGDSIKAIVSQARSDINMLTQASKEQIESYTKESQTRRDNYERTNKKKQITILIDMLVPFTYFIAIITFLLTKS